MKKSAKDQSFQAIPINLSYTQLTISSPTEPKPSSHFLEYINNSPDYRHYSSKPPFLKWITFSFVLPFIKKINKLPQNEQLNIEDLPNPEHKFNIETKLLQLDSHWQSELHKSTPNFSRALLKTFLSEILQSTGLVFIDCTAKLFYSIYLGRIMSMLTSSGNNFEEIFASALILSFLVILSVFAKGWSYFVIIPNLAKARLAISGLLYKKLNSTSLSSLHEMNIGKVLNLMANDINDLSTLLSAFTLILTPFLIALGTYIMWGYFGSSCLIGLILLIFTLFVQIYIVNLANPPREDNKLKVDHRVKLTHEMIEGIRLIKMYTWDKLFQQKIESSRKEEHNTFLQIAHFDAIGMSLSSSSVYVNIFFICIFYTLLGNILSPEKIYASMMILMYLGFALASSHQGGTNLMNAKIVCRRVEEVLLIPDVVLREEAVDGNQDSTIQDSGNLPTAVFEDFTGYWSQTQKTPCLSNINLELQRGKLTAVIGKVGAGKSSLLLSFLKELPMTNGSLSYNGKIAYVEQNPILFAGTVRQNILFGREFNKELYQQVIENSNLDKDLALFPFGDLTLIGERGLNISGGQKARVSLARALYSQSDIYLLDDPFSALDSKVAKSIFDKTLKGDFLRNKIIVLVTHHLNFAKEADYLVFMEDGAIKAQGTFNEIEHHDFGLLNIFKMGSKKKGDSPLLKQAKKKDFIEAEEEEAANGEGKSSEESSEEKEEVIAAVQEVQEAEKPTVVTWRTYKNYLGTLKSWTKVFIILFLYIASHGSVIYFSRYIGQWAEQQMLEHQQGTSIHNTPYIFFSFLMLGLAILMNYLKTYHLFSFFLDSNTELHKKAINALIRAQILFFDRNPLGRILNRFSNDIGILDKGNSRLLFDFIDNGISYITVLLAVCFINPAILVPSVFMLYGLYRVKLFFSRAVILLRTLEFSSRSPMLSAIPETLQGLLTIKIFNQGGRFIRDFMDMLFTNIKCLVLMEQIIRLFAFVLEILIQLLTISSIWIFIALIYFFNFEAGLLGLCLMYLLKIGDQGSMVIRQSIYVDMNMQSAERLLEYCKIKSEAPLEVYKDKQVKEDNSKWPNNGEIEFKNVSLRYREDSNFALKGLSFKIPSGTKVACIGRTGAGKSSIIQALFRMTEIERNPEEGESYIEIDGVNVGEIGLHLLRSSLSIIPQTPVIFADTIRRNLDPFGNVGDKELWDILEEVELKNYVESLEEGLDASMSSCGSFLSTGQKQLICLARAIINKSKIIILDEATANVDVETDSLIQKTIFRKFKDCTILTIAHRLVTIANYDRVIVMDKGCAIEYDTPYALLAGKEKDAHMIESTSVFAEMVCSTGPKMAENIFNIAKNHHLEQSMNRGL